VQLAEDIPGISELPVTVFYSGSDVQRALAAFDRTRTSQASIFVDEAPRGGSDPECWEGYREERRPKSCDADLPSKGGKAMWTATCSS